MQNAIDLIESLLTKKEKISFVLSSAKNKSEGVRSIHATLLKDGTDFKVEYRLEKHNDIKTMSSQEFSSLLFETFLFNFKQVLIKTEKEQYQILINKKNKATVLSQKQNIHNRKN